MKPSYLSLAVLVLAGVAPGQPPRPAAGKPMVLLLDTFQVVEGTVERVGDGYRLRRGQDVTDYTAKQVLFAGESREEVYRQMLARGKQPPAETPAAGDYNSAAFKAFPARTQPVLMNLCASCHCKPDHPSGFKLSRVPAGYADPEASHRNAKEVAKFITRGDPSASPVLVKAVTAHGDQRAPALFNRSHPAYRNLELWVHWAAGPEGSPMPAEVPARRPTAATPTAAVAATKPQATAPTSPAPTSADPYDPTVFNRAMHPGR